MRDDLKYAIAESAIAHAVAALRGAGVPDEKIGDALMAGLIEIARGDPDHWQAQLYGAGVVVAKQSTAGREAH